MHLVSQEDHLEGESVWVLHQHLCHLIAWILFY